MPDNIENKVGLQFCYWKINGNVTAPKKGGSYLLYEKDKNEFYIDENCIGGKTTNPKHTVDNARWAFIYDDFFKSIENTNSKNITENLWGPLSGGITSVSKYGLGTNYKVGNSLIFNPSEGKYYYGFKQRIELFSETPGTGFYFYIVPVSSSKIDYAYFHKSEDVKRYGESVSLIIMFHGYNLDKKNKYKAKVYLLEETEAKGLTKTEDFEEKNLWDKIIVKDLTTRESDSNHNIYLNHTFNINIDWKKGENKKKNFTVVVEVYQAYKESHLIGKDTEEWKRIDFKNYADNPTKDLINYNAKLLKIQDADLKENSTSSRFIVSEELMDHYLTRIEHEKNNMIQYIGDINYTKREFDPCGYSKITIQDKKDKERDPLVIFDEMQHANQIDKTNQVFTVIAGDERKDITITLDGLQTKNQFCQGLLLDEGQKHTEHKNVFQVDKVYSALDKGNTRQVDATHQKQQQEAGITPSAENQNDTDVIRTNDSYNPSAAQQWKDGTDYKIENDKEITLKLRYLYNKTAVESVQSSYAKNVDPNNKSIESINMLWLFRYFILSDDLTQTFFLPISTCRYPNQIAKIKVYPDIEWEIAFMITIGAGYRGKIKYERKRMNGIHQGYGFKYLKNELQIENTESSNLGWSIMGKCAVNGKEHSLGFEGIKRTVDLLVTTYNASSTVLEVLNPDGTNPADSAAVQKKIIEVDFAIDPPNIGFALSKKFGEATTKEIVPIYKGGFRADPFIGITISVDLVPIFAKFTRGLYGVGYVIEFIIDVIKWLTDSEIYLTFEAGLAVKFDFTLSYNRIDGLDGKKEAEQVVTVEVPISIKAGCKSNDVVVIPAVTRGGRNYPQQEIEKWKVEGQISTTFTFTKTYGYDKDKGRQYEQSKGVWNPAKITITCYEIISSKVTAQPKRSDEIPLFDTITLYNNPKTYTDEN